MPTLEQLRRRKNRTSFIQNVVAGIQNASEASVDVNGGIKTTEELKKRLRQGIDTEFDCSRLIAEAESYE